MNKHICICIYKHKYNGIQLNCKNEIVNNASKWVVLENIRLNEVTQTQRYKYHMFSCSRFSFGPPTSSQIKTWRLNSTYEMLGLFLCLSQ